MYNRKCVNENQCAAQQALFKTKFRQRVKREDLEWSQDQVLSTEN